MKNQILIASIFYISQSNAQIINIDKVDTSEYAHKIVVTGNISLGLEGDKQQQLLLDATNTADMQWQHFKELFILSGSYRFTYNGPQDILNAGYAHLRWRHAYKNTLHPEAYSQYQWDNKRGILYRFVTGVNLRYNYWHQKMWEISLATGLMYEEERWSFSGVDAANVPPNASNIQSNHLKSSNYVRWEGKTNEKSTVSVVVFYQAPFSDFFHAYRVASNIRFAIDVSKHFTFGLAFNSLYDSKPIVPINHFYYSFSNNLAYQF